MRTPNKKDGADPSKAYSGPHMVGSTVYVDFTSPIRQPKESCSEMCQVVGLGTGPTNMIQVKRPSGVLIWVSEGRLVK